MIKGYSGIFRLGEATSTWDADSPVCFPVLRSIESNIHVIYLFPDWKKHKLKHKCCCTGIFHHPLIQVIQREPWEHIKDEHIKKAAASFCGEIWQVPPMFSAIKVRFPALTCYELTQKQLQSHSRRMVLCLFIFEIFFLVAKDFSVDVIENCSPIEVFIIACEDVDSCFLDDSLRVM